MLIGKDVTDELGNSAEVSSTRLRYELILQLQSDNGRERLFVIHEQLNSITSDDDQWVLNNINIENRRQWILRGRGAAYISTDYEDDIPKTIAKRQDGRKGPPQRNPVGFIEKTILSLTTSVEYPTIYAAKREMLGWQFLQLNPEALRSPSNSFSPSVLSANGDNLATVINDLALSEDFFVTDISRDLTNFIPGIAQISVKRLEGENLFIIQATTQEGTILSSRVLSDGTLRLLALIVLKNDPRHHGVLCFEEPENGVHPLRLKRIVDLLRDLSTDLNNPDADAPRQVLVNTHSPSLIPHLMEHELAYVETRHQNNQRFTKITPVRTLIDVQTADPEQTYTRDQVQRFLQENLPPELIQGTQAGDM
jgi:predicted ATPase